MTVIFRFGAPPGVLSLFTAQNRGWLPEEIMETEKISKKLLMRLPAYLNYIKSLPDSTRNISATQMAKALGLGDVMVRKDLAKVASGGRRKLGYVRENLIADLERFLDAPVSTHAVVIGSGRLGQALLDYEGFDNSGLNIVAGFDLKGSVEYTAAGKPIYPAGELASFCTENGIRIAVLTVPVDQAQKTCDSAVQAGIEAIWNFAPIHLRVPAHVVVHNENLAVSLTALRMQLRHMEKRA